MAITSGGRRQDLLDRADSNSRETQRPNPAASAELGSTRDPHVLIPGDPQVLLMATRTLRERDEATFENASRHLRNLRLDQWQGLAAEGYRRVIDLVSNRWFRYSELVSQAVNAIDAYAHHLDWAQHQARLAIKRHSRAVRLEAEARQPDRGERNDINQTKLAEAQSERNAAQEILHYARRSLADAETRLATQLNILTQQLPTKKALTETTPKRVTGPGKTIQPIPGSAPPPSTSTPHQSDTAGSSNSDQESANAPAHPSPLAPAPRSNPTSDSPPPVSITISSPPTVPASFTTPEPHTPYPDQQTSPAPPHAEPYTQEPQDGEWCPLPTPCPPTNDLPGPTTQIPAPPPTTPSPDAPPVPNGDFSPEDPKTNEHPVPQSSPAPENQPSNPHSYQLPPATPETPESELTPIVDPPTAPSIPQPEPDRNENLATALAVGGVAVGVVGGVAALAWLRSRKSYPIGSGQRFDTPPIEPVIHEIPQSDARTQQDRQEWIPLSEQETSRSRQNSSPAQPTPTTHQPTPERTKQAPSSENDPDDTQHNDSATLDLAATAGIGLRGNGAISTVRALLVTLLIGTSTRPPARLVIPERDWDWILDTEKTSTPTPPGLESVPNLARALDILESEVSQRTNQPDVGNPPLVLVLAHPPTDPSTSDRLGRLLAHGHRLGVTALILGSWPSGGTLEVTQHGVIAAAEGPAVEHLLGATLTGLSTSHTLELLTQLAEAENVPNLAHSEDTSETDPPSRQTDQSERDATEQLSASCSPHEAEPSSGKPSATNSDSGSTTSMQLAQASNADPPAMLNRAPSAPLSLRVFGRVTLSQANRPPRDNNIDISPKQAELLTFLALHPDGVGRDTLAETLWPGARPNRRTNGLHSTLNRLRRTLDQATNGAITNPITTTPDGTYKINQDLVHIDLEDFRAAKSSFSVNDPAEQLNAYRRAFELYRGDLAEGIQSEWIMVYRENTRRDALDAATHFANALIAQGSRESAIAVLDRACAIDPYNESIYRRIMRLQLELNQPDAAQRTLNLLTIKLREIDATPTTDTRNILESKSDNIRSIQSRSTRRRSVAKNS